MTASALVVHPSPWVRDGIISRLEDELGLQVMAVDSAVAALAALQASSFDVALVDSSVIDASDGETLLGSSERLRLIVMTPASRGDHLRLLEQGVVGLVTPGDGISGVVEATRSVLAGEAHVPASLLGTVLRSLVVERRHRSHVPEQLEALSPREHEVLVLLTEGAGTHEIAAALTISPHTAKTHVTRVLGKLSVRTRAEAAALGVRHGLHHHPIRETS